MEETIKRTIVTDRYGAVSVFDGHVEVKGSDFKGRMPLDVRYVTETTDCRTKITDGDED